MAKSFLIFAVLVIAGITIAVALQRPTNDQSKAVELTQNEITPVPSVTEPRVTTAEVKSPKGDKKLTLRATTATNGTTMFEFAVDGRPLFAKTLGPRSVMSLPVNAWDPTDTYVFVEQRDDGIPTYFVFRTDGELFADGQKFIDVGAVWKGKEMSFAIREATGWASGTLLIIYTTNDDGAKGPSFWFEIPSTAIIQLAG